MGDVRVGIDRGSPLSASHSTNVGPSRPRRGTESPTQFEVAEFDGAAMNAEPQCGEALIGG